MSAEMSGAAVIVFHVDSKDEGGANDVKIYSYPHERRGGRVEIIVDGTIYPVRAESMLLIAQRVIRADAMAHEQRRDALAADVRQAYGEAR